MCNGYSSVYVFLSFLLTRKLPRTKKNVYNKMRTVRNKNYAKVLLCPLTSKIKIDSTKKIVYVDGYKSISYTTLKMFEDGAKSLAKKKRVLTAIDHVNTTERVDRDYSLEPIRVSDIILKQNARMFNEERDVSFVERDVSFVGN